jgi:hypothetical protein
MAFIGQVNCEWSKEFWILDYGLRIADFNDQSCPFV